ncbi:hypothetical protein Dimus_029821 [Dionaea muscipula]
MSPPTVQPHFLVVTFPVQSHINPAIQFAKRLLRVGATVTIATAVSAHKRMTKGFIPDGITIASISDGYDNGYKRTDIKDGTGDDFMSKFKEHGSRTLSELIDRSAAEGRPVTCLVYTILITWAAEVARRFLIPSALLWIQPAALLNIYYHYLYGYGDAIKACKNDPDWSLELPGLPLELKMRDLPSFVTPNDPYTFLLKGFKEQFEDLLEHERRPRILVNTFDALEPVALRSIERLTLTAIGPLLPSAFLDGKDQSDRSSGVDLFKRSKDNDYVNWLDSKPDSSVVYVSFGSISVLCKRQMEEMARGLVDTGRPFLWVIRAKEEGQEEERLSCMEEVERRGMIVPWCSQVEVLSHRAVGCFVTHCGWNSSLESLASGVPMVGFPQWTDQPMNAKMIEDLWRTGVRVKVKVRENEEEEAGIVESGEIRRCVETVMQSEDMKRNAKKWRAMAIEAAGDGGSSQTNLTEFVREVNGSCVFMDSL